MALTVMEMVAKLGLDDDEFQKGALGVGKSAKTMGDHIKRGAAIAATAITGGLVVAAKIGWDAFESGQVIALQTETVLKSTGNAANTSAAQIKDLAVELQNKSGVDDQVIRSGENLLATFQNVRNEVGAGNDIFVQGTKAALDFSAATGKDMNSSVRAVGRALNDPIKGLSLLTRQGINFTDQEKAQIATMVAHNNIIGAQKLVLDKLNTTYGGSADISSTVAGKMAIARERFKDTAETLVGALLPAFLAILGPIASMGEFMSRHTTTTKVLVAALVTLVPVLYAISAATKIWFVAQLLLNSALIANPIGLIIVGLVALGVALVVAWKRSETFRNIVIGAFHAIRAVVGAVVNFIRNHWMLLLSILGGPIGAIAAQIIAHWGRIRDTAGAAFNFIRAHWRVLLAAFAPLAAVATQVIHHWNSIRGGAVSAFNAIVSVINRVISAVSSLIGWINAIPRHISISVDLPHIPGGSLLDHFQEGGVVGGPIGAPRVVVAHGGETILPTHKPNWRGGGGSTVINNFNGPVYGEERYLEDMLQRLDEKRWKRNG